MSVSSIFIKIVNTFLTARYKNILAFRLKSVVTFLFLQSIIVFVIDSSSFTQFLLYFVTACMWSIKISWISWSFIGHLLKSMSGSIS